MVYMLQTSYRIQSADRDVAELLNPQMQYSISYSDDSERHGVSVCDSIEDLAGYIAQTGIPFDTDYVVVEVAGESSDEVDEDAHLGARLVLPTEIISVEPITDRLLDMIDAAYDQALAA